MRSITVLFLPASLTLILLGGSSSASPLEEATAAIGVETGLVQVGGE